MALTPQAVEAQIRLIAGEKQKLFNESVANAERTADRMLQSSKQFDENGIVITLPSSIPTEIINVLIQRYLAAGWASVERTEDGKLKFIATQNA